MLSRALLLALVAAVGCGPGASPQQVPSHDAGATACAVTFVEGPSLSFAPSERRALHAAVSPAAPGETVRVGIVGGALDSSLDVTNVAVDAEGHATFQLTAPSSAATFRVRATASCGGEAFVDVTVDPRGTGAIEAVSVYRGSRGPSSITVDLIRGESCDEGGVSTVDRTATLPVPGGSVRFAALPDGASYALRATAIGRDRLPLADACAGPFRVREDETRTVNLYFTDRPSVLATRYAASLAFDLGDLAVRSTARWLDAPRAEITAAGGEALVFLPELVDAVGASVPSELEASARAAITNALRGELGEQLDASLARRSARIDTSLQRLAEQTAAGVARVRMTAVAQSPTAEGLDWSVRDVALRLDPGTPDVDADDVTVLLDEVATARLGRSGGDNVVASFAALPLPYARVARRTLGAVIQRFGAASTGEFIALAACPVVASAVAPASALCDDVCRLAACRRSADRIGRVFDDAVARTDATRASVDLRFAAVGRVTPGTLRVERIDSLAAGSFREEPTSVVVANASLTAAAAQ